MDTQLFIDNYITKINEINLQNIQIYKYELKEDLPKKESKEITSYKEMKNFTDARKKHYDKQVNIDNEETFDLFKNDNIKIENEENKINFFDLDYQTKIDYIIDYMKRKKIKLDSDSDFNFLDEIINDNVKLKKYISINKTHNIINRISFFKKNETGNYNIILENNNKTTKKKIFFGKK